MLDLFSAAITPNTRVVAISHVQYTCGLKLPVPEITEMAHRAGALVLIDGAQTGGTIDLDVHKLGIDFYAISGQKWLLGPNATGALYVNRNHFRTIDPLFQTHAIADKRAGKLLDQAEALLVRVAPLIAACPRYRQPARARTAERARPAGLVKRRGR